MPPDPRAVVWLTPSLAQATRRLYSNDIDVNIDIGAASVSENPPGGTISSGCPISHRATVIRSDVTVIRRDVAGVRRDMIGMC
jgi:hypothetical protein